MSHEETNEQFQVRKEKLDLLREKGLDPFGKRFERSHLVSEIVEKYGEFDNEDLEDKEYTCNNRWSYYDKTWKRKSWICPCSRFKWSNSNLCASRCSWREAI